MVSTTTQESDSVASEPQLLASAAEISNPIPTATQEGAAAAAADAGAASGHPAAKGDGSIPKILVVDDDTGQRLMLKAVNDAFFVPLLHLWSAGPLHFYDAMLQYAGGIDLMEKASLDM
jgi:hypothetical protein